jgi:hypothetical protein
MRQRVDRRHDLFGKPALPQIIERHVRIFDQVVQDADLPRYVIALAKHDAEKVQNVGLAPLVGDAPKFFDGQRQSVIQCCTAHAVTGSG